jgi:hypothetical protein
MFNTLVFIQQRLAAIRAAVDELSDLLEQAERSQQPLLPLDTQEQLLLDLDRIGERLEKIGEAVSGAVDPHLIAGSEQGKTPMDRA